MRLNCGHDAVAQGAGPGYGVSLHGYTMCYTCCHADQLAEMLWGTRLFAYQGPASTVTDWPGGLLGRVTHQYIGYRGTRLYVHVIDVHGQCWHGQGPRDSGTYLKLRKIKAK